MNQRVRALFNFFLSVLVGLLIVGLSTAATFGNTATQSAEAVSAGQPEALLAQSKSPQTMKQYLVTLSKTSVVPNTPPTLAMGVAEATLMGDRLTVRGIFSDLSSPLRDYAADPVNPPNPKITSAVHIHRGEATENGPFQFALTVMTSDKGMGGKFNGEYKLSSEQLQALMDGKLYIDLHTKQNRAGELRGYFKLA